MRVVVCLQAAANETGSAPTLLDQLSHCLPSALLVPTRSCAPARFAHVAMVFACLADRARRQAAAVVAPHGSKASTLDPCSFLLFSALAPCIRTGRPDQGGSIRLPETSAATHSLREREIAEPVASDHLTCVGMKVDLRPRAPESDRFGVVGLRGPALIRE